MWVVVGLSCPSQSAITVISTPPWSMCIAVECRMEWGETLRLASCGQALAALWTASWSRVMTAGRVSCVPDLLGNNGRSGLLSMWGNHLRISAAVVRHSGTLRSLRPLPRMRTAALPSRATSATRMPVISDTRPPVLYSVANITRSRCPHQVAVSGASRTACISVRERKPIMGLSKRFIGIAITR